QVAAQGGAQAPADREDSGQVAARQAAETHRQDVEPARARCKPADRVVVGTAARLCGVGARCRTLLPWAELAAGGRLRRGPRKGEPAFRLTRKPCSTMPPSAIMACRG